jgi:hypothetical protein
MIIPAKLKAGFDLFFLFGRGMDVFTGTRLAALLSCLIPLALFPPALLFGAAFPPKGMESGYPLGQILFTVGAHYFLSFFLSLALVAAIVKPLGVGAKFWLFLESANWVGLAASLISIPLMVMAVAEWVPRMEMDRIFAIFTIYSCVVTAVLAYRSFRLNWQLAGLLAIVMHFANQETMNSLYALQHIPKAW